MAPVSIPGELPLFCDISGIVFTVDAWATHDMLCDLDRRHGVKSDPAESPQLLDELAAWLRDTHKVDATRRSAEFFYATIVAAVETAKKKYETTLASAIGSA